MTKSPFIIGVMTEWIEALAKRKKFCCKNVILSKQTRSSFMLILKHQASLMEELLKKDITNRLQCNPLVKMLAL